MGDGQTGAHSRPPVGPDPTDTDTAPAPGTAPAPTGQPDPLGAAPGRPVAVPPTVAQGPIDLIGNVLAGAVGAVGNVGLILRPEAALAVATEFTFPLALALAVLLFLVIQDQVDRRDPKLRVAPQHAADTFVRFEPEEAL